MTDADFVPTHIVDGEPIAFDWITGDGYDARGRVRWQRVDDLVMDARRRRARHVVELDSVGKR